MELLHRAPVCAPQKLHRYSAPPILAAARWNAIPAAPCCHVGPTPPLRAATLLAVDLGMHIQANGGILSFFTDLYIHLIYGPYPFTG